MRTSIIETDSAGGAELSRGRRLGILLICSMSLLIVGLDVTIVNLALPSIGRSLHSSLSGLQWTLDAYTLVLASLLMLSGSTADRVGRRRTFVVGLCTFVAGSLLCSFAPNVTSLIVFRMVQAVGGSMLNPVAMSIITNTFTDARERAQAIGVWAAVMGVSMAMGPLVGGFLVSSVGWRSIFWINVPIGLVAIVLALRYIPESKSLVARRLDLPGQAFIIVALASLTFCIIEAPSIGWTSPVILAMWAIAFGSLVALVFWENYTVDPLLDLRFFRSVPFSAATMIAVASFAAMGGFLFLNALYLQDVRGLSPLRAGIDTLPMAAMTLLFSPISGHIVGRRGSRAPLVVSGLTLSVACVMLVRITSTTPFLWLFVAYAIFGVGFGLVNAPITNAVVASMPRSQSGVAAAIASTSRQIGQTLGVAVVGALVTSHAAHGKQFDFAVASRAGWWVLAGCGAAVLALGAVSTTTWARSSAMRSAQVMNLEYVEDHTR
jgi:EmrB/QacA subfamily drug resistance transporter